MLRPALLLGLGLALGCTVATGQEYPNPTTTTVEEIPRDPTARPDSGGTAESMPTPELGVPGFQG